MKILYMVIGVVVVLIALGASVPILWPLAATYSANITAMTGTDAGTTTMKALWPIVLLLVGMGVSVALIVFALRKFGLIGGSKGGI